MKGGEGEATKFETVKQKLGRQKFVTMKQKLGRQKFETVKTKGLWLKMLWVWAL